LVIRKHPELLARGNAGGTGYVCHHKAQFVAIEWRGNGERH